MTQFTCQIRPRRMARPPYVGKGEDAPGEMSETTDGAATTSVVATKAAVVLTLLQRADGATLQDMVDVTGWLPHTTRAFLAGLRKKGHAVVRDKVDGITRYSIARVDAA